MANNLQTRTVGRFRMNRKEQLRSRPRGGFGQGQGSTWRDPRYPVRAHDLCCGRLQDHAHNTGFSAGGPTFGGMIPTRMLHTARMQHGYVRGSGDGRLVAPRYVYGGPQMSLRSGRRAYSGAKHLAWK